MITKKHICVIIAVVLAVVVVFMIIYKVKLTQGPRPNPPTGSPTPPIVAPAERQ